MHNNSQEVFYDATLKPKGLPTGSWIRVLEDSDTYPVRANQSHILYDGKARPVRMRTNDYLAGYTQVDTKIDFEGKTTYSETKHKLVSGTEIYVREDFTYTDQSRPLTHSHQIGLSGTPQLLSYNEYDELGKLIGKQVGGVDTTTFVGLQHVNYAYNIRGWLTDINDASNLSNISGETDLFAFHINYENVEPETNYAGKGLYNGNISETYWRSYSDDIKRKYGYEYDDLNRLRNAVYQKPDATVAVSNSYNESMTYDKNGNITTLQRYGDLDTDIFNIQIDDLTYTYDTNKKNQLMMVADPTMHPAGVADDQPVDNNDDYDYDDNGNMTRDDNKAINSIKYNQFNLPTEIYIGAGKINYLYDGTGKKVRKTVDDSITITVTDYINGFQYQTVDSDPTELKFFPHAEGYVNNTVVSSSNVYNYVFNYTDHLGNIRMTYTLDNTEVEGTLKILEENHYYPFGMKHAKYNSDTWEYVKDGYNTGVIIAPSLDLVYQYKFNGKEYQDELSLNLYDYGARNYDPALARWMNIDPLAETSRRFNPYTYALNNPVFFIDPDGMEATENDGWIEHLNSKGETAVTYHQGVDTVEQAEALNYQGVSQVVKSGTIVGTGPDGSAYSYHLNDNGTVTNSAGQTTNEGFSTPQGTYVCENNIARVNMAINGAVNVVMGAVGFAGSAAVTGTGIGAVAGVAGMTLSTGEIGIGIGQIANSFQTNVDGDLQNFNTVPGLGAARSGNEYAPLIDGLAGWAPGSLSGGNVKGTFEALGGMARGENSLFNAANVIDAGMDATGVIQGVNSGVDTYKKNN